MGDFALPKPRLRLLLDHFSAVADGRQSGRVAYPLREFLFLVVCGTIANSDDYDDMVDRGEAHLDFLRGFSALHHGIPCVDWLRTLLNRGDPDLFSSCFVPGSLSAGRSMARSQGRPGLRRRHRVQPDHRRGRRRGGGGLPSGGQGQPACRQLSDWDSHCGFSLIHRRSTEGGSRDASLWIARRPVGPDQGRLAGSRRACRGDGRRQSFVCRGCSLPVPGRDPLAGSSGTLRRPEERAQAAATIGKGTGGSTTSTLPKRKWLRPRWALPCPCRSSTTAWGPGEPCGVSRRHGFGHRLC